MEDTSSLSSIQSRSISQSVIDNFKKKVLEMEPEVCFFFFFFSFCLGRQRAPVLFCCFTVCVGLGPKLIGWVNVMEMVW